MNLLKRRLKKAISIDLLIKNNDGSQRAYKDNIDQIDNHVPENYAPSDLEALLD